MTNVEFKKKIQSEQISFLTKSWKTKKKKVDWEKRQNKSQGLWFEAANIESYKFSEKGVDIW